MTFTALVAEMVQRGAEDNSSRNLAWANLAYHEIINAYEWPFTEAEATGTVGAGTVSVSDFRKAMIVADKTTTPGRALRQILVSELVEDFYIENLAESGTPEFWYFDGLTSTIKSWPLGGTIYTRYHKRVADAVGGDTPIFLSEYHNLIVEGAMVYVYADNDEQAQANTQYGKFLQGLGRMADDYGVVSRAPSYIQVGEPYDG